MKQYVVDELRPNDHDMLKKYLCENLDFAGLDGVYWKPIDNALLTFYFALTLTPDSLACELLVRTRNRMRCDCMGYATPAQRNWIVAWSDNVLRDLGIIA